MEDRPLVAFRVTVSVQTVPAQVARAAVRDMQEELDHRPYLGKATMMWSESAQALLVDLDVEAESSDDAAAAVYDDLFESACAVLPEFETLRVQVVDVQRPHSPPVGRTGP